MQFLNDMLVTLAGYIKLGLASRYMATTMDGPVVVQERLDGECIPVGSLIALSRQSSYYLNPMIIVRYHKALLKVKVFQANSITRAE